jgi:hypothetical protein
MSLLFIQVNIYAQFIQFHRLRAYDLTNNGNLLKPLGKLI